MPRSTDLTLFPKHKNLAVSNYSTSGIINFNQCTKTLRNDFYSVTAFYVCDPLLVMAGSSKNGQAIVSIRELSSELEIQRFELPGQLNQACQTDDYAAVSTTHAITVWNINNWKICYQKIFRSPCVKSAVVIREHILVYSYNNKCNMVSLLDGKVFNRYATKQAIHYVYLSSSLDLLLIEPEDRIEIWDLDKNELFRVFDFSDQLGEHQQTILSGYLSAHKNRPMVWDYITGELVFHFSETDVNYESLGTDKMILCIGTNAQNPFNETDTVICRDLRNEGKIALSHSIHRQNVNWTQAVEEYDLNDEYPAKWKNTTDIKYPLVLSGGDDGQVCMCDIKGNIIKQYFVDCNSVAKIKIDSDILYVCGYNGCIDLYSLEQGHHIARVPAVYGETNEIVISKEKHKYLAIGTAPKIIRILPLYNLNSTNKSHTISPHSDPQTISPHSDPQIDPFSTIVTPDPHHSLTWFENHFYYVTAAGSLWRFIPKKSAIPHQIKAAANGISAMCASESNSCLYLSLNNHILFSYRPETVNHAEELTQLLAFKLGDIYAIKSLDKTDYLIIYYKKDKKESFEFFNKLTLQIVSPQWKNSITSVPTIMADSKNIIAVTNKAKCFCIDPITLQLLSKAKLAEQERVTDCVFENRRLYIAYESGEISVWKIEETKPIYIASLFNLHRENSYLWTTPSSKTSPQGWVSTNVTDLIEVSDEQGQALPENRRKQYFGLFNNRSQVAKIISPNRNEESNNLGIKHSPQFLGLNYIPED